MNLSPLIKLFNQAPVYKALADALHWGEVSAAMRQPWGVLTAARPALLAALQADLQCPVLFITARADRARILKEQIQTWAQYPAVYPILMPCHTKRSPGAATQFRDAWPPCPPWQFTTGHRPPEQTRNAKKPLLNNIRGRTSQQTELPRSNSRPLLSSLPAPLLVSCPRSSSLQPGR
jgi:hypothetical protein